MLLKVSCRIGTNIEGCIAEQKVATGNQTCKKHDTQLPSHHSNSLKYGQIKNANFDIKLTSESSILSPKALKACFINCSTNWD